MKWVLGRMKRSVYLLLGMLFLCVWWTTAQARYDAAPKEYYLAQKHVNVLNFTENHNVNLDGTWQFYPEQLLTKAHPEYSSIETHLPISFKKLVGRNQTYGTFVAHFKIPEEYVGRRLAILMPAQSNAYRVYLNGDILVRAGRVHANNAAQELEKNPRIAYLIPEHAYFSLAIQVSSQHSLYGGLEKPIKIGISRVINQKFHLHMMSIAMICGAVLGVGVFTILFSMARGSVARNSKSIFVFGLFIVFLALYNLFSAPYAYSVFSNINWLWGTRLEYLFSFAAIGFFLTHMHWKNNCYVRRPVYMGAMLVLSLNVGITLVAQPEIFEVIAMYSALLTIVVLANLMHGFYLTLKHQQHYSRSNLWAVIFLSITFANDILIWFDFIDFIKLSFISTSLYALLAMFQQSRNYAFHTFNTEQLNKELLQLNDSLDYKVKHRTLQLQELNRKLELQARTDALTEAFNRRALNEAIQQSFERVQQHQQSSLVFVMLDVDFFKLYNDHYGHLKGDEILKGLVRILKSALPKDAFVARYGGEEFAVVVNDIPIDIAEKIMQIALQAVRDAQLSHEYRPDGKCYVSLSAGMAYVQSAHTYADIHELMKAADQQLYQAKAAGRDQLK